MKKLLVVAAVLLVSAVLYAQQKSPAPVKSVQSNPSSKPALETFKDKVSYSIGWDIGQNFKRQGIDCTPSKLAQGLKDSLAGGLPLLSQAEMMEVLQQLQKDMQSKMMEKQSQDTGKNKKEGDEFLAKNKKNKGVLTLPSGLQYKIITEGTGEKPKLTDTVTVNYRGTLIDGTEFDSSYKRGQPATFPVGGVIKGWTEALQLMKTGSKWQLVIPSDIAYGANGAGQQIGPNATLIFDVELISIEKKESVPEVEPAK